MRRWADMLIKFVPMRLWCINIVSPKNVVSDSGAAVVSVYVSVGCPFLINSIFI